jgi:hypothetical protein
MVRMFVHQQAPIGIGRQTAASPKAKDLAAALANKRANSGIETNRCRRL